MYPVVPTVVVQKIDENAKIPCKPKSFHDAGWDVYPLDKVEVPAGGDALLRTGLKIKIPNGYCIQVNPRSGKAVKNKITIGARVIDSPYRGELMIHIFNNSKDMYEVSPHDPVAQLLVLPCASYLHEGIVDGETERGEDGFGSTDSALKYASIHKVDSNLKTADPYTKTDTQEVRASLVSFLGDNNDPANLSEEHALFLIQLLDNVFPS